MKCSNRRMNNPTNSRIEIIFDQIKRLPYVDAQTDSNSEIVQKDKIWL